MKSSGLDFARVDMEHTSWIMDVVADMAMLVSNPLRIDGCLATSRATFFA